MASLFTAPQYSAGNGIVPEDGLKLFFYSVGTLTAKETFTTSTLGTAHAHPVVADGSGVFPEIWMLEEDQYKIILKDKNDVQVGFGVVEIYVTAKNSAYTASAAGSANALTATSDPKIVALTNNFRILIKAASANTTTTPSIAISGLAAKTIVKNGNQALVAGNISGAGHELDLIYRSDISKFELLNPYEISSFSEDNYLQIQEQKSSGTDAGTFASGAYRTRALNTEEKNTIAGASLDSSSNRITLPAGKYYVKAWGTAFMVNSHAMRIYNITDSSVIITGSSSSARESDNVNNISVCAGVFTLALSKVIELQHRCQTTRINEGFGTDVGSVWTVPNELYSEIEIWKVG